MAQGLEGRAVQEGFPEEIPFELHLSDITRERGRPEARAFREVENHSCKGPEVGMHLALGFKKHTW